MLGECTWTVGRRSGNDHVTGEVQSDLYHSEGSVMEGWKLH